MCNPVISCSKTMITLKLELPATLSLVWLNGFFVLFRMRELGLIFSHKRMIALKKEKKKHSQFYMCQPPPSPWLLKAVDVVEGNWRFSGQRLHCSFILPAREFHILLADVWSAVMCDKDTTLVSCISITVVQSTPDLYNN